MVVLALLAGICLGAAGVFVALRPALIERRRRMDQVVVLERELAATRAELAVERQTLDDRLESAIKTLAGDALDANAARFIELADARMLPLKESLERMD